MNTLLNAQPEVTQKNLSTLLQSLYLKAFDGVYTLKTEFDIAKLHNTFVSILRGYDSGKIYSVIRTNAKDLSSRTQYTFAGEGDSKDRILDILELLNYIQSFGEQKKALNIEDYNVFGDLLVLNTDTMKVLNELKEQGVDPLSDSGYKELSDFFWNYKVNFSVEQVMR